MEILNSQTVISDVLKTTLGIETYLEILEAVKSDDFCENKGFRKKYNGFYKVRQKKEAWYDCYYTLMKEQKYSEKTFKQILEELNVFGAVDVSFASKLISTINPELPIWDQYVIRNIGFESEWEKFRNKDALVRIEKASEIYEQIKKWYLDFKNSAEGKKCIDKFDEALPEYIDKLSTIKKIDYLLWAKR